MKVCHIITTAELGGAQLSTLRLLQGLAKADQLELFFLFGENGTLQNQYFALKNVNVTVKQISGFCRKIHIFHDVSVFFKIYRFLKQNHINILHTHTSKASLLGRFAAICCGIKAIHTYHGFGHDYFKNVFLKKTFLLLEKILNRFSESVIFICSENFQKALKHRLIYKTWNYQIIPDMLTFERYINRKHQKKEVRHIGSIISFKEQKQPFVLLNLMKKLNNHYPPLYFSIAGKGPLLEKSKIYANKIQLKNISFLNNLNNIENFFHDIDLFIQTSRYEGLSMSQLEALFFNVPLVVTNQGGIKDIIESGKQGFLYEMDDINQAFKYCKLIIEGKFTYHSLDNSFFDVWNSTNIIDNHLNLYKSILE